MSSTPYFPLTVSSLHHSLPSGANPTNSSTRDPVFVTVDKRRRLVSPKSASGLTTTDVDSSLTPGTSLRSTSLTRSERASADFSRTRRFPFLKTKPSRSQVAGTSSASASSQSTRPTSHAPTASSTTASSTLTAASGRTSTSSNRIADNTHTNSELRARDDSADPGLRQVRGITRTTLLGPFPGGPVQGSKSSQLAHGEGDKMHQTSSRLLRMTDDERPFTRDFKDLFSTLMVSLPLGAHRVRFRSIDSTFTTEEAITNLGSLKFSQSNRMPDPKDPSRVVTTTTTTTFSMAREMARSVLNKFVEARFIESCEGKTDFSSKNSVWQMTPKGIHILERFCARNGITQGHVKIVIDSLRNPHQLVILEREVDTDKLNHDEQTAEIIFRRFAGSSPNSKGGSSDSDSVHEFSRCDVGIKMMTDYTTGGRTYHYVFSGKALIDWLMDCSTMVDPREGVEVGTLFVAQGLIQQLQTSPYGSRNQQSAFPHGKQDLYYITPQGEKAAGWIASPEGSVHGDLNGNKTRDGAVRETNSNRMLIILENPAFRLLYREFMKDTFAEENLSFYLEVKEFLSQYNSTKSQGDPKVETIRETLAAAYSLYNAFLAPGSPNELNIDHSLRTSLAARMTRAVGDDQAMMKSLDEVALLFEKAQASIFKLMASDSVPKFIKNPKYQYQLRGLDSAAVPYASRTSP